MTIGGVPEHFNLPIKQAIENSAKFSWLDCPGGSGEMRKLLQEKKIDAAIMLTEAAVSAFQQGDAIALVDEYVSSPLRWGIFTHPDNVVANVLDSHQALLISRLGSGSHLIPFAKAHFEEKNYSPKLEVIQNLDGALAYFGEHKKGLFYWEEVTTSPYVEKGLLKQVGVYPTPWPCFVMVCNENTDTSTLKNLLAEAKNQSENLKANPEKSISEIAELYKLNPQKTKQWFGSVLWQKAVLSPEILAGIVDVLFDQNIISEKKSLTDFVKEWKN